MPSGRNVMVNDAHSLSPGHITTKRCQELDKKRQFNATQHRTVKQKRRRIELKGKTYETAIDSADDITPDDIVEIPPPLLPPSKRPSVSAPQPDTLIVFDIETTGLDQMVALSVTKQSHYSTTKSKSRYRR
ncbi:hypothetical protein MAR_031218 [Mya arenaria]|uniref:Exonuclease domain-containing protein n=1 Tax=Mya arenaria TaxID=6604 RepID=A0ABY7F778_MYAAR|nr:hypothetical protein MAR_031218 [Mya arenaria]